ncbi:MAG: hypothetical protein HY900_10870 [Deltaproteobacteria bacterium]|nr:hypothetical protein [Deltaproteobacteria bacterium]
MPIVDVLVLAAMYTLRIFAGALAIGVSVSSWLLAFSMFLFLSLAFLKRYNELRALSTDDGVPSQESLAGRSYRRSDLEMFLAVGPASGYLAVLVLALYIESPQVVSLYSNQQALWLLCPLLLYWVTRLWFLVHRRGIHHDPVAFALKDPASWGVAILSALVLWAGIRL